MTEKIERQDTRNAELEKIYEDQKKVLHEISGLSKEEATQKLLAGLETELHDQAGSIILKHEKHPEKCEAQARNLLLLALQRYAASHTAEATTSTVDIPNDDMKGRIIVREGRNIRAFEKVTGVDVIIDDTPGVVIVSAFDSIRREIARLTLNRLISDGRIHPSRIEEIFNETNREVQAFIQRAGFEAVEEVEAHGLHERLVNYLGRLYFRTSYSQNVLRHSVEVAFLAGMIAVELGLDERLARRCGLLHDIGKAADHEIEGGHPKIGADIAHGYGEPYEVFTALAIMTIRSRTTPTPSSLPLPTMQRLRREARREVSGTLHQADGKIIGSDCQTSQRWSNKYKPSAPAEKCVSWSNRPRRPTSRQQRRVTISLTHSASVFSSPVKSRSL